MQRAAPLVHALLFDARQSIPSRTELRALRHLWRWTTTTITKPVRLQPMRTHRVTRNEILLAREEVLRQNGTVVVMSGREMGENLTSIDAAPHECHMRKAIRLTPTHLVRDEGVHARVPQDLRKRCRKPEGIGEIHLPLRRVLAERALPVRAAMQHLTDETFA